VPPLPSRVPATDVDPRARRNRCHRRCRAKVGPLPPLPSAGRRRRAVLASLPQPSKFFNLQKLSECAAAAGPRLGGDGRASSPRRREQGPSEASLFV
jgi:hypothetical protein